MIKIITDSVASIPADEARDAGIEIVTLYVNRDGVEYADAAMDLDAFMRTSMTWLTISPRQANPLSSVLEELFEDAAEAGDEVLGIFISSGFVGAPTKVRCAQRAP